MLENNRGECTTHKGEKLYFYCVICDRSLCRMCIDYESHITHTFEYIEQDVRKFKQENISQLQIIKENITSSIKQVSSFAVKISNLYQEKINRMQYIKNEISKIIDNICFETKKEKDKELKNIMKIEKIGQGQLEKNYTMIQKSMEKIKFSQSELIEMYKKLKLQSPAPIIGSEKEYQILNKELPSLKSRYEKITNNTEQEEKLLLDNIYKVIQPQANENRIIIQKLREELAVKDEIYKNTKIELSEAKEIIRKQKDEIEEKGEIIRNLKMEVEEKGEIIRKLQNEVKERDEIIRKQKMEVEERDEIIRKQKMEVEEKCEIIKKQKVEIEEKDEVIRKLQIEVKGGDEIIRKLKIELSEAKEVITKLKVEVEERDEIIRKNQIEVKERDEIIKNLKIELSEAKEVIKKLKVEIDEKDEIMKKLEIQTKENLAKYYVWPNKSLTFKSSEDSWISVTSCKLLPVYFSVEIKIVNLNGEGDNSDGGIGIAKNYLENGTSYIGEIEETYGIMTQFDNICKTLDNNCHYKYGKQYGKGDIITMIYNKSKNLSYKINGEDQGVAFNNLEGPFYLFASLYYTGSEIEILQINELK